MGCFFDKITVALFLKCTYKKISIRRYEMKLTNFTYSFETSHKLTQTQIDWLNKQILEYLPTENDFEDIPEWTTEISETEINE